MRDKVLATNPLLRKRFGLKAAVGTAVATGTAALSCVPVSAAGEFNTIANKLTAIINSVKSAIDSFVYPLAGLSLVIACILWLAPFLGDDKKKTARNWFFGVLGGLLVYVLIPTIISAMQGLL